MERIATCFKLKEGMQGEYKKRHDEIWSEMSKLMKKCGIKNYSIWNFDDLLFGYFEVEDFKKRQEILNESTVKRDWDEYMSDIIEVKKNPKTGLPDNAKLMFLFDG